MVKSKKQEDKKMSIKNLNQDGKMYTWRNAHESRGVYYTNRYGEGVFFQSDRTGQTKQLVGTCQFSACSSMSGTRKKINRMFDEWGGEEYEDPRI